MGLLRWFRRRDNRPGNMPSRSTLLNVARDTSAKFESGGPSTTGLHIDPARRDLHMRLSCAMRAVVANTAVDTMHAPPHWMSVSEWQWRVGRYAGQGRTRQEIIDVRDHLIERGPAMPKPSSAALIERAKAHGVVHRREFISSSDDITALAPADKGLPNAWLQRERNQLLITTPVGWVNPRSRSTWRAGIFVFAIAGTGYHESAVTRGDFTPGSRLVLRREPDNQYDPNAIEIYASRARNRSGYVPKDRARRLAPLIDGGTDIVAVATRGDGPGRFESAPYVLACERSLFEHLARYL